MKENATPYEQTGRTAQKARTRHHAEAVLRANETGIRLGVQQSGMTFGALRLRVRGEERERDVTRATYVRRRRTNEREI